MKFKILAKTKAVDSSDVVNLILENRGLKTKKGQESFLNPNISEVSLKSAGINLKEVEKAKKRIQKAIKNKEQVVVFGDYDVDGICGTAILWETLNSLGAKAMPYIPHRVDEGYGLSEKGIKNLQSKIKECSLIITVDNGIVANQAVDYANAQKIDVIITDHHVPGKKKPNAFAIIHSTKLCGASVAWLFSKDLGSTEENHLELAAIATIADLVPITELNRIIAKEGIEKIKTTKRLGLCELFKEAALDPQKIGGYEIGHIIAPRINAMGRIDYAMDSLRLLCSNNKKRVSELAVKVSETNRSRQNLTIQTTQEIIETVRLTIGKKKLLFISDEKYNQGIIGLVAGKLVEEFYLPSIVVSRGDVVSKGSARSIKGFNIIDFIRSNSNYLVEAGGHPMAAGFTVKTDQLVALKDNMEQLAEKLILPDLLKREILVDCELPINLINLELAEKMEDLSPFGPGNPTPVFVTKDLIIQDMKLVGANGSHIKLILKDNKSNLLIYPIGFGLGERAKDLRIGDKVTIVYTISKDEWNGNSRATIKVKEIEKN